VKRLKVISDPEYSSNSYYRTIGPLSNLDVIIDVQSKVSWASLADGDILYIDNPRKPSHYNCIDIAKNINIPVWVDLDDNMLAVKQDNSNASFFYDENVRSNIIRSVAAADIVTVTTKELLPIYSVYNKNVHHVPNAFNDYWHELPSEPSKNKIVNWRGGGSHHANLITFIPEINELVNSNKEWMFNFIGENLWYLNHISGISLMGPYNLVQYFNEIKRLAPSIQIVPLQDTPFDRARSHISWLEATFTGAVTVGPNFEEWDNGCVLNYSDKPGIVKHVNDLIADEQFRKELFKKSVDRISEDFLLSKVNKKRTEIIDNL